ncbi:MAG TPA: FAD-dependent oxidoreductase, partial [Patescibacteria group bacterium]|nr:FAD-dependent oxidoreductase [Patescibacteria group bacterium]
AERRGARIFTRTHAAEFNGGDRCEVVTDSGVRIFCAAIVVATNTPVNDRLAIHTKQAAYRTYVVGLSVPRDSVPRALYWDTEDPYHYVRLQPEDDYDVLIVGGEDHKTGQAEDTEERFARLEAWARGRFAAAGEVLYRWSGQVMEPNDGVAYIGRNPFNRNIYIVTGDSGNGITHGTIAGMLLPDLIAGRDNEWASLYDPGRISLMSAASYAKENLNMAAQYSDLVTGGDVESAAAIPPGEGAILRDGATKIAAFRDENGKLHSCSAICPHLWGVVRWNGTEKTWDCPCHGSRFDAFGTVLNGPARSNLKPVDLAAPQEGTPVEPATDNGVLPYRS